MTDNLFWRNRIVDSGAADPQELAKGYNPDNWRHHPQIQRDALEDALDSIGVLQPVLFNRLSGKVIDGHLRIELAILKGQPLIPVNYVELTDDEEALALATLDAITEQAEPIPDKLAALLERTREMTADRPGLGAMLQKLKERAGINGHQKTKEGPPLIDKAAELQKVWGVKVGDVWEFPSLIDGKPHRVICGDCTDKAVIKTLMMGGRARLAITDPPYDGQLGGAGFNKTPDVKMRVNRMQASIKHLYTFDPNDVFPICETNVDSPASWFFFCNKKLVPAYINYALDSKRGFDLLLWHKPNFLPMAGAHYFPDTEYLVKIRDKGATFNNGIPKEVVNYGTYWVLESQKGDSKEAEHPTIKPTKIICDQIDICSNRGELVLDPFLGSGTTLIAAHQLGRICYGCEIEPSYCAVTLERWSQLTGQTPRQVSGL